MVRCFSGKTIFKAGYKGDTCLFYTEISEPGDHIDDEAACRGSAWAGSVSLKVGSAVEPAGVVRDFVLQMTSLLHHATEKMFRGYVPLPLRF